jgi:hypothetical protein
MRAALWGSQRSADKKAAMNTMMKTGAALASMLILVSNAGAASSEGPAASTAATPGVVTKVENAVARGAHAAASGIQHGVKAAAGGVERGATAAGSGVKRAADATARGVDRGAKAAARGVDHGAKATAGVANRAAKKVGGSPDSPSAN